MTRDPSYTPFGSAIRREPKLREVVWSLRNDDVTWSSELLDFGSYGVEGQILRDGELVLGQRFDTRALAEHWSNRYRQEIERSLFSDR